MRRADVADIVPDRIEREVVIAAPVERVWAALTEAEQIGAWFADGGADVDLRPGGTMTLRWKEHGASQTVIEQVEPPHFLSWRWAHGAERTPRDGNSTLVEFQLTPDGEGTRLRVVESGFRGLALSDAERARYFQDNSQGWREEMGELRDYVQRQAA
jgi:uncharacterized protein YndB with AHSA1/START domain